MLRELVLMKSQVLTGARLKTDEEYQQEIDRTAMEIRVMLDSSRRSIEKSKRMGKENARLLAELEQRLLYGKS
jgi:hypothetical protein